MSETTSDEGVIEVLIERLDKQRLPRLLEIEEKVNGGGLLDNFDIGYLENAMADANNVLPIVDRHPEYQMLATKVIGLYKAIMDKGLENEKKQ